MQQTTSNSLTKLALQRFKKNFWGVLSFWFILICALIAILAYVLAPDSSKNANQMHLSIHSKGPGFSVKMLTIPSGSVSDQSYFSEMFFGTKNMDTEIPIESFSFDKDIIKVIPYTEGELIGISKSIELKSFPEEHNNKEIEQNFISDRTFILGTDKYGRDMLSRMLIGIRISFSIGFVAVLISLILGISLGAIAGYFGGKVDVLIMWLINVTWSIPTLLLVIAITLALGKGFWQVFIAVGLTMWVEVARVVRGQVLSIKQMQYVTAAKALGFNDFRIITKHVLPNSLAPVIVISAANFAAAILIESGLSFLGIGAQPPMASWGAMIKDHYSYIILGKAYLAIIPGLGIMSLVMAFMLIGNALRDALDVKG
ncbi:ABC transporter permease [Aquimarina sp. MMG015]|uniref:ABC transporter permease n=1 Tax=unclassified Aquimarina TaxID=2627091 RepID=UPI000E5435E4|nr:MULTISPECIES: ABC transporter permease [unclassified Aquimarina]AXT57729.1 ABC transporter permease [Aquimarina sp. AD1]MBQ4805524.1 ABC transporter permease [Aquimarina sp. MMG015]RKN17687.1 ABC transporter permease subunit [Aquimarina sp. AD1]